MPTKHRIYKAVFCTTNIVTDRPHKIPFEYIAKDDQDALVKMKGQYRKSRQNFEFYWIDEFKETTDGVNRILAIPEDIRQKKFNTDNPPPPLPAV